MELKRLSASRINTYKDCEFKYFLEYHLRLEEMRGDNIYSAKGTCVHEALEFYARHKMGEDENSEPDYEKTLLDFYAKSKLWELDNRPPHKGFTHPVAKTCESCPWATKDNKCKIADSPIPNVIGCPRPNFEDDLELTRKTIEGSDIFDRKILGAEVRFKHEFDGGVVVNGVIDLVTEVSPKTIEIIDFKTGNKTKSYDAMRKDPQSRTYSLIAHKLWPEYDFVQMTLWYLRKRPVTCIFTKEDDELTLKSLKRAWDNIKTNTNPSRPSRPFWLCNFCIGHDRCGEIRENFKARGRFMLPTVECSHTTDGEPCWGSIKAQPDLSYSCMGHWPVYNGGVYKHEPADDSD